MNYGIYVANYYHYYGYIAKLDTRKQQPHTCTENHEDQVFIYGKTKTNQ